MIYIPYEPHSKLGAVDFDGTNDSMRNAALSGLVDGKLGIFSGWINPDVDSSLEVLIQNGAIATRFAVQRSNAPVDNCIRVYGASVTPTVVLDLHSSVNSVVAAGGWYHVMASWDLANGFSHLYINDASDKTVVTLTNTNIDYSGLSDCYVGMYYLTPFYRFDGQMCELYLNTAEYLDLSLAVNRRKFISAAGTPVYLGANGEIPTGNQPIIYLQGSTTFFDTNRGSGGDFTITGALGNAATSPGSEFYD